MLTIRHRKWPKLSMRGLSIWFAAEEEEKKARLREILQEMFQKPGKTAAYDAPQGKEARETDKAYASAPVMAR